MIEKIPSHRNVPSEKLALLNQNMNLQFTGVTRRSRDVAMLSLY
ncbi:hypothetical protein [Fischerella thermalis]|nr:hypothetical protein [Fischerella thermalis]